MRLRLGKHRVEARGQCTKWLLDQGVPLGWGELIAASDGLVIGDSRDVRARNKTGFRRVEADCNGLEVMIC